MKLKLFFSFLILHSSLMASDLKQEIINFSESDNVTLNLLQQQNYFQVLLPEKKIPWESSYWPNRAGSIAYRDSNFSTAGFYLAMLSGPKAYADNLVLDLNKMKGNTQSLTFDEINKLSASEKYDLLMGDDHFTFTRSVLKKINENDEYWGKTTYWTGICHGWTPASIFFESPRNSVIATSPTGQKIEFTVNNLKALSSFMFANNIISEDPLFIGNRCNQKRPKQDSETNLVMPLNKYTRNAQECADISPHLFHLVLLNRLGINQRPFITDIDYNSPVNNHPTAGYDMKYYNVLDEDLETFSLSSSIIPINQIPEDKFKWIRSDKARYVIGFKTKVYYVDWTRPNQSHEDKEIEKRFLTQEYNYQLELDHHYNIVNGIWVHKNNKVIAPDFIWSYKKNTIPREFKYFLTKDYNYSLNSPMDITLGKKSRLISTNMLRTNYKNRVRHPLSKELGIYKKAVKYAKEHDIELEETEAIFLPELNKNNVPFWEANPQILSNVIIELMNHSKE